MFLEKNFNNLKTSAFSTLISTFSFSLFNSSSKFNKQILGLVNFFGCCSNPA